MQRLCLCVDAIIALAKKLLTERLHDKHRYKKTQRGTSNQKTLEL
jgi:hypothetical protein